MVRFDPAAAQEKRRAAAEARHVDIDLARIEATGVVFVDAALDVADALDLEQALARRATLLGQLGDHDSRQVRRAKALGELARHDLTLDLHVADPETGEITRTIAGRKVELVVHLDQAALHGDPDAVVARCGNTRTPISPAQVKDWLATPNTKVTIRPVIDLAGHQSVDSYEIPDRLRRQVTTRDHHCVFPHCTRPAEQPTWTTSAPTAQVGPPAPATSPRSAAATTATKPAATSPTACSTPAPTTGPPPPAPGSSTQPAPTC